MDSKTIQKYSKYSVAELKTKAQRVFNAFIRQRDSELPCVSCGTGKPEHAGHYFSAGHNSKLRFDERNVAGQCVRCNYFLHGNQTGYRKGLIKRIGIEAVEQLESEASIKGAYKWDRYSLIEIIEKYK